MPLQFTIIVCSPAQRELPRKLPAKQKLIWKEPIFFTKLCSPAQREFPRKLSFPSVDFCSPEQRELTRKEPILFTKLCSPAQRKLLRNLSFSHSISAAPRSGSSPGRSPFPSQNSAAQTSRAVGALSLVSCPYLNGFMQPRAAGAHQKAAPILHQTLQSHATGAHQKAASILHQTLQSHAT